MTVNINLYDFQSNNNRKNILYKKVSDRDKI